MTQYKLRIAKNRILSGRFDKLRKSCYNVVITITRMGISGTTTKSRKRKFVPSSHPGPFAVVASSRKSQTKVGTLACFSVLFQNELTM